MLTTPTLPPLARSARTRRLLRVFSWPLPARSSFFPSFVGPPVPGALVARLIVPCRSRPELSTEPSLHPSLSLPPPGLLGPLLPRGVSALSSEHRGFCFPYTGRPHRRTRRCFRRVDGSFSMLPQWIRSLAVLPVVCITRGPFELPPSLWNLTRVGALCAWPFPEMIKVGSSPVRSYENSGEAAPREYQRLRSFS